jgi:glutamate synthase (NADPH/NADH) small chain
VTAITTRRDPTIEGIEFQFLTAPTQFFGNTSGWVAGMEVIDMELGEPDSSRRRPVPIKGTSWRHP